MRSFAVYVLLAAACATAGCGQKGPLVLPDAQHAHKKAKFPGVPKPVPPAPSNAPASPTPTVPGGPPAPPAGPPVAPPDAPQGVPPS